MSGLDRAAADRRHPAGPHLIGNVIVNPLVTNSGFPIEFPSFLGG